MAPEVIRESDYDSHADIWSLGITAIELAKGNPPHHNEHPMKALITIPSNPPPVLEGDYSKSFKEFVAACLHKDQKKRATAHELLQQKFVKNMKRPATWLDFIKQYSRTPHLGQVLSESDSEDDNQKWDFSGEEQK